MNATRLRVEYLEDPIGIDIEKPRFFWNCDGGKTQSAYRIVCKRLWNGGAGGDLQSAQVVWDSGKVVSPEMTHIPYEGSRLTSRDRIEWAVTLWDENDVCGSLATATFEMGLLSPKDWRAKWIAGNYRPKKNVRYPVDCFRKDIPLRRESEVVLARLYVTARGVYDAAINGKLLDDHILAPGITDYRKRLQYQTFDVTEEISNAAKAGNTAVLDIRLGDGWFRGSSAAYGVTNVYGNETAILAQLEITYADGTTDVLATDANWRWSSDGEIRFADLKDGEDYDARKSPSFSALAKLSPLPKSMEKTRLVASNNVPVRRLETFSPTVFTNESGRTVYDFGQNIAGILRFSVKAKEGTRLRFVCAEILDEKKSADLSPVQETVPKGGWTQMKLVKKLLGKDMGADATLTPRQEIVFTASGNDDVYQSAFTVLGFRYAELFIENGDESAVSIAKIEAVAIYSAMEETGAFSCSDERINKLHENTVWSMKGNFLDIPTDCPTRERLGWTGDAQIFFNTGAYLCDTAAFFRKWLFDMEDARYTNGLIPAVLPFEGVEMMYKSTGSSVGWADAVYLIPYRYYKRYGDVSILERHWEMIEKYADYLFSHTGLKDKKAAKKNPYNKYTYEKGVHLGEWLEPEEFRDKVYGANAPHPEECTAYLYLAMKTIGEIAGILGHEDYARKCHEYADGAKKAYRHLFIEDGSLAGTKRQAKLVRPLALGLLDDDEEKDIIEAALRNAVEEYGCRVGTGFLSTPFLLPGLTAAGDLGTAYKVLENPERPGWLSEVDAGATTVWESWEGDLSQNHYSPGAVCEWLYETVGGIYVDDRRHFTIAPKPGGSLTAAKASYQSLYGRVLCAWERESADENSKVTYKIEIPPNTTATVVLPDGTTEKVSAGRYGFS